MNSNNNALSETGKPGELSSVQRSKLEADERYHQRSQYPPAVQSRPYSYPCDSRLVPF